jgi:hypothetical protein
MVSSISFYGPTLKSTDLQFIASLSPAAWFRLGQGITEASAAVSQWNDASGNARHLKQATGAAQPAVQADGSILFDGTSDYLKCDAFTLDQPFTIYALMKAVTWTSNDRFWDGNTFNTTPAFQGGLTPQWAIFAGSATIGTNANLAVDTYGVIQAVYNGASSLTQVNLTAAVTGSPGANAAAGFTLGANATPGNWGNIQVKEVIICAAAHDDATRARVVDYLNRL